ncbi:radical SAM family heme chaperone HemW [Meiothermus hypogaeus]|uniref:Heme chaperone HemW n=2 Tax=Meiothermus hypogaeus TaxID=884155 RepID=A0A511R432_9DEIN|nr:radical SAM family heme chaperone HemW [Meiothermus hypogaeus]RIH74330.1 Oxygen-independent coproporphyrinogen-III oxidase-like protein [Meiothermus hypogaeus]GEM84360.1 coproporphyrinogen III oxidase [Meiothermus hypogaeus NBRC 106114]
MKHIYVHVPFCPTLCPYCDFHVLRRHGGVVAAYLKRLTQEAKALYAQYPEPLKTLYFGGGTPSFLRSGELQALFAALPWDIRGAEVTLEANPGTLNPERLQLLRGLGVNRLSLGVQSFQDEVLRTLGRAHGRKGALKAVEMSLEAGFRTSLDLILGLPGQDFEADLREARALGVGHISAYTLQIEPGTPFALANLQTDEEQEARAFERAEEILGEAGFVRYEVSNFALPLQESQHNKAYWQLGFWGALGPGAAAHLPAKSENHLYAIRTTNPPLPRWLAGEAPAIEEISPLEHIKEALMLGLRLAEGVEVGELERQTSLEVWEKLEPAVRELEGQELLWARGKRIGVARAGVAILHRIILRLWEALEAK